MSVALVARVLKLRQAALRITTSKLERGLDATRSTERLYDMAAYHGAHTGRITGRGMQLLNLPKGVKLSPDFADELLSNPSLELIDAEAERLGCTADDVLSSLIRPTLYGENLLIADYNAIELRGVAWMAGDVELLAKLRDGVDLYTEIAEAFGTTRQVGKVTVLGCIYGMGENKFESYAATQGIALEPGQAKELVTGFRSRFPRIVRLWRSAGFAIKNAVGRGTESSVGHCRVAFDGDTLLVTLPSSRVMRYHAARIEDRPPAYSPEPIPTVVYTPAQRRTVEDPALWGSKCIENWCQAICRDLCYDALMKCEAAGLHPVLHVYDEIATEDAPCRLLDLTRIMEAGADWSIGFPIRVESRCSRRYGK